MPKRLLFICYWSVSDNLTIATVLPRLKLLHQRQDVVSIVLVTIERNSASGAQTDFLLPLSKVMYLPFQSGKHKGSLLEKVSDFIQLPIWLARLAKAHHINTVLAHGSPAGALAYKLWKKSKLPFYVSSFEPHSSYMVESGVWKKYGLKYLFQAYWEEKQKKHASGLMPVANNYTRQLISEGISPQNIFTVPCTVDTAIFEFNTESRTNIRLRYNWQNAIIGIYAGKFGSLYYDKETYFIFKSCFNLFPDFRLIILTPEKPALVEEQLLSNNIDRDKVFISSVPHQDVPAYLSAADFAFAPFKPGPSKKYLSPVKVAEYWASGLPVLLTEGIGDDSTIVSQEGGGALFDLQQEGSLEKALQLIKLILQDKGHRSSIARLAHKYRSPERLKEAYTYFFGEGKADL